MEPTMGPAGVTALLKQARWMESLAACLLRRREDVDDVVQETWTAAIRHPPDPGRPVRPWLAQVVRNVVRMRSRAFVRRQGYERAVAVASQATSDTPHELLERAQLHRLMVDLVMALDEPYRGTVLLRFFEACSPAEISRRHGVPAGTVRWRLNEAVRRLRTALDAAHGGDRERWRALLLPLAGPRPTDPAPSGARPAASGAHPFVLIAGLLAAGAAGWAVRRLEPTRSGPDRANPQLLAIPHPTKENDMRKIAAAARITALTLAVPALAAAAAADKTEAPPTLEEGVTLCTTLFERVYDCREQMADAYVVKATAEERKALRRQALAEVIKDSGDPEKQCAPGEVAKRQKDFPPKRVRAVKECLKLDDCQPFATCIVPVIRADRKLRSWERR